MLAISLFIVRQQCNHNEQKLIGDQVIIHLLISPGETGWLSCKIMAEKGYHARCGKKWLCRKKCKEKSRVVEKFKTAPKYL